MILDLVKELKIEITDETALIIMPRLKPEDWAQVKKDLESAIQKNESTAQSIALVLKILESLGKGALQVISHL